MRDVVTIDFETFFDPQDKYSLSAKGTTPWSYCRDPRFHVQMLGVMDNGAPDTYQYATDKTTDGIRALLLRLEARNVVLVAHNMRFDGLVIRALLGRPYKGPLHCTLSMAKTLYPHTLSRYNLHAVSQYLGLSGKIEGVLDTARGIKVMGPELEAAMLEYMEQDVVMCDSIYTAMRPRMTPSQMLAMEWSMDIFCNPQLKLDTPVLEEARAVELERIAGVMARVDAPRAALRSGPKFAALLEQKGVIVPTKVSKTTGETTLAFAKTDLEFLELLNHADPTVVDLVEARLGAKSSILETRLESMIRVANAGTDQLWPVHLNTDATHTGRVTGGSGGGGNPANFPRGSALRHAIIPSSREHVILAGDLTGVELRVARYLANDRPAIAAFAAGSDLYVKTIAEAQGAPARGVWDKSDVSGDDRFVGKVLALSSQYGASAGALHRTLNLAGHNATLAQATELTRKFREVLHPELPAWWYKQATSILSNMMQEHQWSHDMGDSPVWFSETGPTGFCYWDGGIRFPSGKLLSYNSMHTGPGKFGQEMRYVVEKHRKAVDPDFELYMQGEVGMNPLPSGISRIYGPAFLENMSQAIVAEIMTPMRLEVHHGLRREDARSGVAMEVYDELVCTVPRKRADYWLDTIEKRMSKAPVWWRDLPLAAELGVSNNYGEAK